MSGAPIFALRKVDDQWRYFLIGIQVGGINKCALLPPAQCQRLLKPLRIWLEKFEVKVIENESLVYPHANSQKH